MKKNDLMLAIGEDVGAEDEEILDEEAPTEDEDEAIETFLDDTLDMEARKAAFRAAVKACMGEYE